MITKQTNEIISVFVTPEKLREIAGCLERQKERASGKGIHFLSAMNVVEGLDSLHTQLHADSTTVWFRLPTEEQGEKKEAPVSTLKMALLEPLYCPESQHEDNWEHNDNNGL